VGQVLPLGDEPFLDDVNDALEMLVALGRVVPADLWVDEIVERRRAERFRGLE
jgi:hypothetical protein